MDTLWAPWRYKYLQKIGQSSSDDTCVFCLKQDPVDDRSNLVLLRGKLNFVLMNLYPYNNGHLMVIPCHHTAEFTELNEACWIEIWKLLALCKRILTETMHPDGFNIGMNIGRSAGAGIDEHLHLHILPRWNGDANFITTIGQTKVISQSLEDGYDLFKPLFDKYSGDVL